MRHHEIDRLQGPFVLSSNCILVPFNLSFTIFFICGSNDLSLYSLFWKIQMAALWILVDNFNLICYALETISACHSNEYLISTLSLVTSTSLTFSLVGGNSCGRTSNKYPSFLSWTDSSLCYLGGPIPTFLCSCPCIKHFMSLPHHCLH